jgi:hypothetical protein
VGGGGNGKGTRKEGGKGRKGPVNRLKLKPYIENHALFIAFIGSATVPAFVMGRSEVTVSFPRIRVM